MTPKEIAMVCCGLALFAFGPFYGYRIAALGKRRSWSLKKIKRWAALPFIIPGTLLFLISFLWRRTTPDYLEHGITWAIFPWLMSVAAGNLAMAVASRVARPGGVLTEADN